MELVSTLEIILVWVLAVFHTAGVASAVNALFSARSSQGAIAWVMSMITFPYVAVPLYWVFGRDRFMGYVSARRSGSPELDALREELSRSAAFPDPAGKRPEEHLAVLERLAGMPFTGGNAMSLLVDGEATFKAIYEAVDQARDYVLVQFFIIHDDQAGQDFKDRLAAAAARGVRVLLLYDEIGCHALPSAYLAELRRAGVDARAFNTTKGWRNRLQVNFRNHRKIVVADGRVAFVGGHNVGDEYMGRSRRFGRWRDTHVRCEGPAAALVQLSFTEDWYWAALTLPELTWDFSPGLPDGGPDGGADVLALPSGPADTLETFTLAYVQLIESARERLWIASPYFVPDREVTAALQLAALRGVDVRVMLPSRPDHRMVYLASFSYFPELERQGVKFYRYQPGFLHQKVVLVDSGLACVGTANCDTRSFRLNFELTMVAADREFASRVEAMLAEDFAQCFRATAYDYEGRWIGFKAVVRLARLLSPIL
jgi:cardiolipin synthase